VTLKCNASTLADAKNTVTTNSTGPYPSIIRKIRFANTDCTYSATSSSATKIECILDDAPVCGSWLPEVYSDYGLIPLDPSVAKIDVECTVTSITPNENLNVLGDDSLTIVGTNFPKFLKDNTVDIGFSNSMTTKCLVQHSQSTKMVCLTKPFDKVANLDQSFNLVITINGKAVTQNL
jgi:hypothetical protein